MTYKPAQLAAIALSISTLSVCAQAVKPASDPFLTKIYWKINDSPMQQRLRSLAPFPVSVVYYQQINENEEDIYKEVNKIKQAGFTSLKQLVIKQELLEKPGTHERIFKNILDQGVSPWYYGMGGWEPITEDLCKRLNIKLKPTRENMAAIEADPKMVAYQTEMLKRRADNMNKIPEMPKDTKIGEPGRANPFIPTRLLPRFAQYLQTIYPSVEACKKAWLLGVYGEDKNTKTWEDLAKQLEVKEVDEFGKGMGKTGWDLRRFRDAMRFHADLAVGDYKRFMEHYTKYEPNEPKRTGGHQLFENQAYNGWDLEGQAKAAAVGGSFYSSVHLAHHFFLTDGEITRPAYMQARIIADNFKGGWAATWESTGGPTQYSGTHSFTMGAKEIRKLMLSYLAAGLKGIGFWTWNSRDFGWEFGEYALTNLQGEPSERAMEAANLAKAIDKQRFELWDALDQPTVGILYSWENEALLGRLSLGGYPLATRFYNKDRSPEFGLKYSKSRIGISRALMNNNIPFEYVSENDLKAGLAGRYDIIYMPYMVTLPAETQKLLADYVSNGGRLVTEMPTWYVSPDGYLNKYQKGELFEKLFGFQVTDYSAFFNAPKVAAGVSLSGLYAEIKPTTARVSATYPDGSPLVVNHIFGKGTVTALNFEAGFNVSEAGHDALEALISKETLGNVKAPFGVQGKAMVFRRASDKADHFFIINDGPATSVTVTAQNGNTYSKVENLLDANGLSANSNKGFSINLPAYGGAWVRAQR